MSLFNGRILEPLEAWDTRLIDDGPHTLRAGARSSRGHCRFDFLP